MDIGRPSDLIAANIAVVGREGGHARLDGVDITGPVIIDPGARVGRGARVEGPTMLADGASVGEGAVVTAGSVVSRDVAPYTVVAGHPARPIKSLKETERVE